MAKTTIKTKSKGEIAIPKTPSTEANLADLRDFVKDAAKQIDVLFITQGLALAKISASLVWQNQWNHPTWRDYITNEVGISYDRAMRLQRIASVWLNHFGIEPAMLEKVGYTKLVLMFGLSKKGVDIVNEENVKKWMQYAAREDCSYYALEIAIHEAKNIKDSGTVGSISPPSKILKAISSVPVPAAVSVPEPEPTTTKSSEPKETGSAAFEFLNAAVEEEETTTNTTENGEVELLQQKTFSFKVYPHQLETIQGAIDRLAQTDNIHNIADALEMICGDFLGTQETHYKSSPEYIKRLCGTMSSVHGGVFSHDPKGVAAPIKFIDGPPIKKMEDPEDDADGKFISFKDDDFEDSKHNDDF